METFALIVALLVFSPALWALFHQVWRSPEAISTPAWLAAANALFLFVGPLVTTVLGGSGSTGSAGQVWTVIYVCVVFYSALALVYTVLKRGVFGSIAGVRGGMSAFATLKQGIVSSTPTELLVVGAVLIAITTYLNAVYALNVSGGSDYFKMARLPYAVVVVNTLTMPMTLGMAAALAWLAASRQPPAVRLVASALLLAILGNTLAAGRRELLWFGAMVGVGILWSGRRRLGVAIPVVCLAAYFVLFVFAPIFLRARLIYSSANSPGVAAAFRMAAEEQRAAVTDQANETLRENMSGRFNTLGFWEEMYASRTPGELDGQILTQGITMALPRAIVGFWKYKYGAVDESILGTIDICNSIPLESFLDLGYHGPLVYGVIIGVVYALGDLLLVLTAHRMRVLAVLSCSLFIRLLLGPEVNLISTFSDLRTVLIYFLIAALIAIVFGRRPIRATEPVTRSNDGGRRGFTQAVVPVAHGHAVAELVNSPGPVRRAV